MTYPPPGIDAALRVEEYLNKRNGMGGPVDREVIHSVWVGGRCHELRVDDLRELISEIVLATWRNR